MSDRGDAEPNDLLSFGPFSLLTAERLLRKADEPIPLGGRALDILIALLERPGEVVTHQELISTVWPYVTVGDANLRVHIAALRKALGDGRDGARYVSSVAGRGYCLVAPVTRSSARRTARVAGIAATERVQKLPPRPARMVGRDDTVRSLAQQLQIWRFVSIVGPGGVGKTTVAISVAHTLVDGFHDAVFFIDLAALTDALRRRAARSGPTYARSRLRPLHGRIRDRRPQVRAHAPRGFAIGVSRSASSPESPTGDPAERACLRHATPHFSFFHRIQRAKASTVRHAGRGGRATANAVPVINQIRPSIPRRRRRGPRHENS